MSSVVENICHLPEVLEKTDISTAAIITQSGLLDHMEELDTRSVRDALAAEPQLVNKWLDRRTDQIPFGGWKIEHEANGFVIRNFASGSTMFVRDKLQACAEFIVRYVALLLTLIAKYDLAYAT